MNPLYHQYQFPVLQNRVFDSRESARNCEKGDIHLSVDKAHGFVYNSAFVPESMNYDNSYNNEQSHSSVFKEHLTQVAEIVSRHMGSRDILEIGCGQGTFVQFLRNLGLSVRGVDPSYRGSDPAIRSTNFSSQDIETANGIVLRHVLEHLSDPVGFLQQIANSTDSMKVFIEVPCVDWILDNSAWFDIFYEHVNYFRISDFERLFGGKLETGRLFGGQYLYVVANLEDLSPHEAPNESSEELRPRFRSLAERMASQVRAASTPFVWGASSKGVIYSLLRERFGQPVELAIDINPEKWGRYLPATGVKVIPPHSITEFAPTGTQIVVMNPNYASEINAATGNQFQLIGVDGEPI